jgi:tRNA (mo5U34)-methyltransferase
MNEIVRAIPSGRSLEHVSATLASNEPWFYEFRFSNGAATTPSDDLSGLVHRTRAEMIFPLLDDLIGDRWPATRCLDMACHEGWFATQLAARGAAHVEGIDIRAEHVRKATVIKELSDLDALTFDCEDALDLTPEKHGTYDLTLLLGFLYHVDNPLGVLRVARFLTRRLCVIETVVARGPVPMECRTVSVSGARRGHAVALVPSNETHAEPGRSLALVPTLDALYAMLHSLGFTRVYLVVPPPAAYEQYQQYDRIVLFAM